MLWAFPVNKTENAAKTAISDDGEKMKVITVLAIVTLMGISSFLGNMPVCGRQK